MIAAVDGNNGEEDDDAPDSVVAAGAGGGATLAIVGEDFTPDEMERRRRGGSGGDSRGGKIGGRRLRVDFAGGAVKDRVDIRHCQFRERTAWRRTTDERATCIGLKPYFSTISCPRPRGMEGPGQEPGSAGPSSGLPYIT